MTCTLIDDEPDCLELLALLLHKYCPELVIVGQYDNAQKGIAAIQTLRPDLVLLDVEMPGTNGFGVLEACRNIPFQVVFTTAFNEYAVKAFKYSAIGYLLKPVEEEDLVAAIRKAQQVYSMQQHAQQRDILFDFLHPTKPVREKIALPTSDGLVFLPVSEIICCEASGNYTSVFTSRQQKPALFTKSLKEIAEMLPEDSFFRLHHSYLINIKHVEQYIRGEGGAVKMSNGNHIPVARPQKQALLDLLGNM